MEFGILGPLAAWKDGADVPIPAAKQRALLAVLLLHRNELVTTERSRLDPVTLEALTARGRSLTPEQVLELFDERGLSERERRDSNPRPPA